MDIGFADTGGSAVNSNRLRSTSVAAYSADTAKT